MTPVLTSKEIETQVAVFRLRFLQVRDRDVEWNIAFPMFVDTFRRLVEQNRKVPTQDDFVEAYFEDNKASLSGIAGDPRLRDGLEARIRRTYPSFVRDLHLDALLRESGFEVTYERDIDVAGGVDHVVKYKGEVFMVHGYVGTVRGRLGRRVKNYRHEFRGKHVDIVLDMSDPKVKQVGDFFLYSANEVDRLRQEMDKLVL